MGAVEGSVPDRARRLVLLVEDEEAVRKLLATVLERAGFAVLAAKDASEALALTAAHHHAPPDVVLPGTSGTELARQLPADTPGLKILLMSGYAVTGANRRVAAELGTHLIHKPFGGAELLRTIRDILRTPGGRSGRRAS